MANTLLSMLSSTPIAETTDIIYYAIAAILTLAIVLGIAMLSKVKTAVAGNLIGSAATLLAIVLAMWYFKISLTISNGEKSILQPMRSK